MYGLVPTNVCTCILPFQESGACSKNLPKWQSRSALQCTLPYIQNSPALCQQLASDPPVSGNVTCNLFPPELLAGGRPTEQSAVVAMPEATVNKDDGPPPREHEVGFAGESLYVKPVSISQRVKPAPDLHLWFGVGRPDASHDTAADIGRNNVSQQRAFVLTKTAAGPSPAYA